MRSKGIASWLLLRNIRAARVFTAAMSSLAFLEALALTSAALYAGATYYVALVEQPSRLAGSVGVLG